MQIKDWVIDNLNKTSYIYYNKQKHTLLIELGKHGSFSIKNKPCNDTLSGREESGLNGLITLLRIYIDLRRKLIEKRMYIKTKRLDDKDNGGEFFDYIYGETGSVWRYKHTHGRDNAIITMTDGCIFEFKVIPKAEKKSLFYAMKRFSQYSRLINDSKTLVDKTLLVAKRV